MHAAPALSVVIPAHNEARRIGPTLHAIQEHAKRHAPHTLEIIVVDDGSQDETAELALKYGVQVLKNKTNQGKGFCVRRGMLDAKGDAILMCDADLATPIEEVDRMIPMLSEDVGVVIGSRALPGAILDPPQGIVRRIIHRVFRVIRRRILMPGIYDTQCGFKLFSRKAAHQIFPHVKTNGFAFDCEALALAQVMGYSIREVPVQWSNDPRSAVRLLRDGPEVLRDILRIRRRLLEFRHIPS